MSSNLLSQRLPISSMEMGQLEPILKNVDSSIPEIQMGGMGSVSTGPEPQQLSISNKQMELNQLMLEPIPDNPGSQGLSMTYMQMGQIANGNGNLGSQKLLTHSSQLGEMGSLPRNVGSHQVLAPIKRKAPMEPLSHNPATHQLSISNKRVVQMEHRPWLQQTPAANRRTVQVESVPNASGSQLLPAPNKKMVKMESFSGRYGALQRSSSQKNQTPQTQPSPKVRSESFETVRSKMRESLASALALVNQQQDKSSESGKKSQGETEKIQDKTQEHPQSPPDVVNPESKEPKENLPSSETCSTERSNDGGSVGPRILADANTGDSTLTSICDGKNFQSSNVLPYEDVPFGDNLFIKDELLQGNGLSWVLDPDIEMTERKEIQPAENQKLDHEDSEEHAVQSPEQLALKIESELFKLFGGVNKKYKEKGRSLLFNLKDRNNPELRERVMSGGIPPERLCSMTAEELASKELSEWRMAKAEELAQMVVLPDSDVDFRRLVKKTHKGEFQVEVEQYDNTSVDVSVDAISYSQGEPRSKETEASTPLKPGKPKDEVNPPGEKSNIEEKTTFTFPSTDGSDLLHGLMVDDGLKDLPPIVSLDEFMESLDMEPPFEILPEKVARISDKDDSETGPELKSSVRSPKNSVYAPPEKHDEVDATDSKSDDILKTSDSHTKINTRDSHAVVKTSESADLKSSGVRADVKSSNSPENSESTHVGTLKGEHVWGGSLQLNISTMASVIGIYKSGEKTSAKEWPGFLEIKGRVRLDAFEKFLQELPQSRSRAVMVVHFVPKVGSSETECANLREVGDSYISDERVGFAEPCSGVELYICPPHNKTIDMLSKIIHKQHIEALNTIDNGLVGVIVWRKLTSPNSSSHHKHISKKQQYTSSSRKQHDTNLNTNFTSKPSQPRGSLPPPNTALAHDDDDDVPPGFGPPPSRDEDDLPEFNFSGGSNPSVPQFSAQRPSRGPGAAPLYSKSQTPSRPVEQMRELILKYGQNNNSSAFQGGVVWNDDDDDIPEWQPNVPQQSQPQYQRPQLQAVNNFQQPMLRPHLVNQPHVGSALQQPQRLQSQQPQVIVAPALQNPNPSWQQQGPYWGPPLEGGGMWATNIGCQPEAGQFYGESDRGTAAQSSINWRQNAPKSRGF